MGLFDKWWDVVNSKDGDKIADLAYVDFIFFRRVTGKQWTKNEFLDVMLTDVRVKTTLENRRFIYENDKIIVSH